MKKLLPNLSLTLTFVFSAFAIGFLLGRYYNHTDIQVSVLPSERIIQDPVEVAPAELSFFAAPTASMDTDSQLQTETSPPETLLPTAPKETEPPQNAGLININTATQSELEALPGIGPVIAGRIIEYRETHGPFTSVIQLINVGGIGEKRMAAIIDLVTVE